MDGGVAQIRNANPNRHGHSLRVDYRNAAAAEAGAATSVVSFSDADAGGVAATETEKSWEQQRNELLGVLQLSDLLQDLRQQCTWQQDAQPQSRKVRPQSTMNNHTRPCHQFGVASSSTNAMVASTQSMSLGTTCPSESSADAACPFSVCSDGEMLHTTTSDIDQAFNLGQVGVDFDSTGEAYEPWNRKLATVAVEVGKTLTTSTCEHSAADDARSTGQQSRRNVHLLQQQVGNDMSVALSHPMSDVVGESFVQGISSGPRTQEITDLLRNLSRPTSATGSRQQISHEDTQRSQEVTDLLRNLSRPGSASMTRNSQPQDDGFHRDRTKSSRTACTIFDRSLPTPMDSSDVSHHKAMKNSMVFSRCDEKMPNDETFARVPLRPDVLDTCSAFRQPPKKPAAGGGASAAVSLGRMHNSVSAPLQVMGSADHRLAAAARVPETPAEQCSEVAELLRNFSRPASATRITSDSVSASLSRPISAASCRSDGHSSIGSKSAFARPMSASRRFPVANTSITTLEGTCPSGSSRVCSKILEDGTAKGTNLRDDSQTYVDDGDSIVNVSGVSIGQGEYNQDKYLNEFGRRVDAKTGVDISESEEMRVRSKLRVCAEAGQSRLSRPNSAPRHGRRVPVDGACTPGVSRVCSKISEDGNIATAKGKSLRDDSQTYVDDGDSIVNVSSVSIAQGEYNQDKCWDEFGRRPDAKAGVDISVTEEMRVRSKLRACAEVGQSRLLRPRSAPRHGRRIPRPIPRG